MEELLILFRRVIIPARRRRPRPVFSSSSLRSASSKTGRGGQSPLPLIVRENGKVSCFANYTTCPALLAPRQ